MLDGDYLGDYSSFQGSLAGSRALESLSLAPRSLAGMWIALAWFTLFGLEVGVQGFVVSSGNIV